MLFQKFNKSEHDLYLAHLLPLSPNNLTFEETVEKCEVFGDNISPFNRRFECLNLTILEGEDVRKYTVIVNRALSLAFYEEICLKLSSVLDKDVDFMLHNLVDEYEKFRSFIVDSNMVESNETRACLIKKPEIDRSPGNNPTPQPQPQTQHTYPKNPNYKPSTSTRTEIRMDAKKDSVRAVNDGRTQAAEEASSGHSLVKHTNYNAS
ncbi:unnamed protein product [Hymenolepis diminuta]|uniref:Uncharacterized protein n=1 Tax=Hymenolepis diminuta TaxID=6216 RepID=A0A564Z764_HYMDI|nr:unnamed protein product [Hymenolepis diminuta]